MNKMKNNDLTTLEEFKEKNYGKRGTKKRDELDAGYESFLVSEFGRNNKKK
jgi:hypothetical protein